MTTGKKKSASPDKSVSKPTQPKKVEPTEIPSGGSSRPGIHGLRFVRATVVRKAKKLPRKPARLRKKVMKKAKLRSKTKKTSKKSKKPSKK